MSQVKSEEEYEPCAPAPDFHIHVHQEPSHHKCFDFLQGGAIKYLFEGRQNLLSMATSHTQTLQHQASTIQYYGKELSCMQHCGMLSMQAADPVNFLPAGTRNFISTAMKSTQTPQTAPQTLDVPQNGTAGDFTSCQLRNPSSNLPQGVVEASAHSSHKPTEDALQKRELRLMKNREAARECRRKKKEYVKCLENRVAVLENQNKTLIEELRALKDICRHKVK